MDAAERDEREFMQSQNSLGGAQLRSLTNLLLGGLIAAAASPSAHAWSLPRNDEETKILHQKLANDFAANPYFKNAEMNRLRDGRTSQYLDSADRMTEQADPLPREVLAVLPEGRWVSLQLFSQAVRGMRQILANFPNAGIKRNLLTIVDFNLKTESRRFLVVDLELERVLFQTWVHHGRRSDEDMDRLAERFGNVNDSNRSSTGFLLTSQDPYMGQWGYSLRMHGIDGSLNSNVHRRAIVIHPWPTIHPRQLATLDPSSTSLGCLSLPWYESGKFYGMEDQPLSKLIIDTIKGRSVIFVSSSKVALEDRSLYLKTTSLLPVSERNAILARVNQEDKSSPTGTEIQTLPESAQSWLNNRR